MTALSILRLLPYPAASHPSGKILFNGENLLTLPPGALRQVRGNKISMIFQEPMTSLNPLHTIEQQVGEVLKIHRGLSDRAARERVLDLLDKVGIDDPKGRLQSYPHQLSGGQRQRVMIAMALANEPDLLIADEPTTALDVTIQAQILDLLLKLKDEFNMAMLLITHDLGIVRKMADRVCVMNNGEIVERGTTRDIFAASAASLHQASARLGAQGLPAAGQRQGEDHPRDQGFARVVSDQARLPQAHGRPYQGGRRHRSRRQGGPDARRGRRIGLGQDHARAGAAQAGVERGADRLSRQPHRRLRLPSSMRPLRRHMQIVFQDPYGSLSPRLSVGQIIEEGLGDPESRTDPRRARRARRRAR